MKIAPRQALKMKKYDSNFTFLLRPGCFYRAMVYVIKIDRVFKLELI